jgi:3-methyladenine DNA glycosylase AlkD
LFLPVIEKHSDDERNFVKKAVNWALRQIGKRNENLNRLAVACACRIKLQESRSARWIAADALRELTSDTVCERLNKKKKAAK